MVLSKNKILKLIFAAFCLFCLSYCAPPSETGENIPGGKVKDIVESVVKDDSLHYDLIYQGILPCKDCAGIKTTLKLSTRSNKFILREEFLETKISPSILMGNFNTERGFEKDEDATLYVLNDELPETEHLYFLRETGKNELLLKLNNGRQKTDRAHFELKKVFSSAGN